MRGGSQRITASGVIGVSGKPITLFGLTILSGADAGVINVYSGTDATGTLILPTIQGSANAGKILELPAHGEHFPGGCYIEFTSGSTTSVVAHYEVLSTA